MLIASLLISTSASAANRRAQEREARKACLSGDYTRGVAILSDLFVDASDPTYIFNQGRCYEQNMQYAAAIGRFEEYLRTGETMTLRQEDREAAEKHIADCKAHLPPDKAQASDQASPAQPDGHAKPEQPTQAVEEPHAQPQAQRGSSVYLTAGIITGAVGLAAVGAGIAFNLKVNSMVSDMETQLNYYTSNGDSTRSTYRTLAWVGYGAGAACVATGSILVAIGLARTSSSSNVALVPAVMPHQAGMAFRGAF